MSLQDDENLAVVGGRDALDLVAGVVGQQLGELGRDPLGADEVRLNDQVRVLHQHEREEVDGVHPHLGVPDPEVADQGVDVDHVVLAQLGARFRPEK